MPGRISELAALTAALFLLSFLPVPVRADVTLPIRHGSYILTQAMVDDDLEIWQIVAGKPLTASDRQAVSAVDKNIFQRDPVWLTTNLRLTHKNLPQLRHADPVIRAGLRQMNLVAIYCTPQKQHLTPEEAAQLQAVLGRYIPVIGVDAASGTVISGPDIDAWVSATQFITTQAHVPGPGAEYRENLQQLARNPSHLGKQVRDDAANMERNWAAFNLVWPHLTSAQRAKALAPRLARVQQAAAQRQNLSVASAAALMVALEQFGNYPYALDPRLAAYKRSMDRRMGRFQQNMMHYNMQSMMRGQENYQRSLRGESPDIRSIPLPVP